MAATSRLDGRVHGQARAKVELASPERTVGIEIGATNYPIHQREMYGSDVIFSPTCACAVSMARTTGWSPCLRNEYSLREEERVVDQIVAEHGTLPNEALYFALKPHSTNLGELDHRAIRANQPQAIGQAIPPESSSSSASATPSPAATSTPRSTTPCGYARTCRRAYSAARGLALAGFGQAVNSPARALGGWSRSSSSRKISPFSAVRQLAEQRHHRTAPRRG
jgi:hypothetical protein